MNGNNPDYSQYEKNNTLAFALASMMFEKYTHILIRRRKPGRRTEHLGGGNPIRIIREFGNLHIESCSITPEGFLIIMVE